MIGGMIVNPLENSAAREGLSTHPREKKSITRSRNDALFSLTLPFLKGHRSILFAKIENPKNNSKHIIKNILLFPNGHWAVVGRMNPHWGRGAVYPILR